MINLCSYYVKGIRLGTKKEIEVLDMVPAFKKCVILGKTLQRGSINQTESREAGYRVESLKPDCWV